MHMVLPANLCLKQICTQPVVAKANKLKTNFTDSSQLPVSELSWARLPPTAAMQRKRAFEKQMAPGYKAHAAQRVADRAAKIQKVGQLCAE